MNRIKAFFTNRKFSLYGLIDVICTIVGLIVLVVTIVGFGWFASTYPAETGAIVVCLFAVSLAGLILCGIFDTIFPKIDDLEIDKWIERAKKELEKQNTGENDESN